MSDFIPVSSIITADGNQLDGFCISRDIRKENNSFRYAKSALEYQQYTLPSLANLVHAFFGKDVNGNYASEDYRRAVMSSSEEGEWTCSFVQQRERGHPFLVLINNPEFSIEHGRLSVKYDGNNSYPVIAPTSGWVTKFDMDTGWPLETSKEQNDAKNVYGINNAYFDIPESGINGVLPICRYHPKSGRTPFLIYIRNNILGFDPYVGFREIKANLC